ncbi:hypothetical protein TI39_contig66g00015 [Zymoseptoria brevis]|uniref:Uncharacterized protein n=1 Tax=Zymoseptoria brevis TaxID=1047168 RepID=A0A0F4GYH1_9PEZI|nr:hypothetical protein TI39_contig66g00015 [Zymoseptoria brevis]
MQKIKCSLDHIWINKMPSKKRKAETDSPETEQRFAALDFDIENSDPKTVKEHAFYLRRTLVAEKTKHTNLIATHARRNAVRNKDMDCSEKMNGILQADVARLQGERDEARVALTSGLAQVEKENIKIKQDLKEALTRLEQSKADLSNQHAKCARLKEAYEVCKEERDNLKNRR